MDERQAVKEPESSEFRQDFEQPQRPERISLGHNYATQTCFSKAANGFVSGTILGATMSGVSGMARATQLQIRSVNLVFVRKGLRSLENLVFSAYVVRVYGLKVILFN